MTNYRVSPVHTILRDGRAKRRPLRSAKLAFLDSNFEFSELS